MNAGVLVRRPMVTRFPGLKGVMHWLWPWFCLFVFCRLICVGNFFFKQMNIVDKIKYIVRVGSIICAVYSYLFSYYWSSKINFVPVHLQK